MRSRFDGLIPLVVAHLAIACISSAIGGMSAPVPARGTRTPGLVWEEAARICSNNVRALVLLAVAGVFLVGVSGVGLFALNGYVFGQMVMASNVGLARLWLFVPLELVSFAVGAAAAMSLGLDVARWLRRGIPVDPARLETFAVAVGLAGAGLAVAAVLEAIAIRWEWIP